MTGFTPLAPAFVPARPTPLARAFASVDATPATVTWTMQSGSEVEVTLHTGLMLFALGVVAALLGLYISYQAYRGYRRNRSRPMLYLAAGIALLTFVPSVLSTVAANVAGLAGSGLLLGMVSRIAGLLAILYGIKYA